MSLEVGKKGAVVTIVKSSDLSELGLGDLAGRTGSIVEAKVGEEIRRENRGYWIKLAGDPYMDCKNWFIPRVSVKITKNKRQRIDQKSKVEITYDEGAGVAHITHEE